MVSLPTPMPPGSAPDAIDACSRRRPASQRPDGATAAAPGAAGLLARCRSRSPSSRSWPVGAVHVRATRWAARRAGDPGTPRRDAAAFQPFWDTYHTISDRYAGGAVDRDALIQGAIRGMIESLGDPYSAYLTSDEYRKSLQGISGQFEGIGAEIASQAADGTAGCAPLGPTCQL